MTLFFCIFFFSIFAYSLFYILPEGYHENKDKLNDIDIYICVKCCSSILRMVGNGARSEFLEDSAGKDEKQVFRIKIFLHRKRSSKIFNIPEVKQTN